MRRPRRTRSIPALVLTAASLAFAAPGCRRDAPPEATTNTPVPVTVHVVRAGPIVDTLTASGVVVPAAGADWTILAPGPSQIASISKVEGQAVAIGDELVRFDVPAISDAVASRQAESSQALARVEQAKRELAQTTALFDNGLVPRQQLDAQKNTLVDAQSALVRAKAELDVAQFQLQQTIVKARFAGIVIKQWHVQGEFVAGNPNDPILRVVDPTRVQVLVTLSAAEIARVNVGQRAVIRTPAAPEAAGTVVGRPAVPDPTARTVDVRVAFSAPATLALETPVEVQITLEERENALIVPRGAILREDGVTYVMVAGADDRAHRQDVRVGLTTSTQAHIVTGVNAGDRVIVTNLEQISEGTAVVVG
jgi:RND family efflux transporter MFP subunit